MVSSPWLMCHVEMSTGFLTASSHAMDSLPLFLGLDISEDVINVNSKRLCTTRTSTSCTTGMQWIAHFPSFECNQQVLSSNHLTSLSTSETLYNTYLFTKAWSTAICNNVFQSGARALWQQRIEEGEDINETEDIEIPRQAHFTLLILSPHSVSRRLTLRCGADKHTH
jgi:hypothetical protein